MPGLEDVLREGGRWACASARNMKSVPKSTHAHAAEAPTRSIAGPITLCDAGLPDQHSASGVQGSVAGLLDVGQPSRDDIEVPLMRVRRIGRRRDRVEVRAQERALLQECEDVRWGNDQIGSSQDREEAGSQPPDDLGAPHAGAEVSRTRRAPRPSWGVQKGHLIAVETKDMDEETHNDSRPRGL